MLKPLPVIRDINRENCHNPGTSVTDTTCLTQHTTYTTPHDIHNSAADWTDLTHTAGAMNSIHHKTNKCHTPALVT